jgi:D-alanine-D-alanine ligase-like ATP-grasp enzyme/acylphosphatase
MANSEATLTVTRLRATSYRPADHGQHFLVQLRATGLSGSPVDGVGECRPQRDRASVAAWDLLVECLRRLDGRSLPVADAATATAAVREIMAEFAGLADEYARSVASSDRRRRARTLRHTARSARLLRELASPRRLLRGVARQGRRVLRKATGRRTGPLHGTLLGLEAALTELVSRALTLPPSQLSGRRFGALEPAMPLADGTPEAYPALFERVLHRVLDQVSFPSPPPPTHDGQPSTRYEEVPYLKPLGSNGTKGHLLERAALRLGLSTVRFSKGAFLATDGTRPPLIFKWSRSPRSSAVSLALCTHKEATRLRLRRAGVPVPKGRTFASGDYRAAETFAGRIGYPVVVKPAMGVRGIGVVANIRTERELQRAFGQLVRSRLGRGEFIVEQHVTGRDYRIVVVGDEVIAAILREPASVEGDGEHTVAELMVNKNVARRLNPHLWGRPIKYGEAARYQLERAGLTLGSVLAPGEKVLLSNSCSLSQGGDSIDVLDELHPSIKQACVQAVRAVPGLWFCGVDFLIEDHTKPLSEQQAGICELNAHAAIGNCEYPLYGSPRQVAKTVLQQTVDYYGLATPDKPADRLSLRLTIRGRVNGVGYRTWMQRHARDFGITGWVRNLDQGVVEAVLAGDTSPVSALAAAAVLGPRRANPSSVTCVHIASPGADDFTIEPSPAPAEVKTNAG